MGEVSGNGELPKHVQPTLTGLLSILRRARIREAATANAEVRQWSQLIERARLARVRARRNREQGS